MRTKQFVDLILFFLIGSVLAVGQPLWAAETLNPTPIDDEAVISPEAVIEEQDTAAEEKETSPEVKDNSIRVFSALRSSCGMRLNVFPAQGNRLERRNIWANNWGEQIFYYDPNNTNRPTDSIRLNTQFPRLLKSNQCQRLINRDHLIRLTDKPQCYRLDAVQLQKIPCPRHE